MPPLAIALRGPRGICFDRASNLYIVDTSNHRVLRIPPGGVVQTIAGNGSPGDSGDGGQAKLAQLNQPAACQLDSYGNLYIADTLNHRVRKVSAGGVISTVAGTGAAGYSGDDIAATSAQLAAPLGVAADDTGNLYIADSANHRVRLVTSDGVIHTIAGFGVPGPWGDNGPALAAHLDTPAGLLLDGSGALYVADSGNNRIRRLTPDTVLPPDPIVLPPSLSVVNALSAQPGPVAPGEIVSIFGVGPRTRIRRARRHRPHPACWPIWWRAWKSASTACRRRCSTCRTSRSTRRRRTRWRAPLPRTWMCGYRARAWPPSTCRLRRSCPALLPLIVNPDGSPNTDTAPVAAGTVLTLYATGEGLTDGANISGQPAGVPLAHPLAPVVVTIAGIPVDVLFAGRAPGLIGVMQINARVPGGFLAPGKTDLSLTVGATAAPSIPLWLK